jgi:peptide deformylase
MVRKIVLWPDPILRKKTKPMDPDQISSAPVQALIRDMIDTVKYHAAAGLAAPQVGVLDRVFVLNIGGEIEVVINPSWQRARAEVEKEPMREGCLSLPGIFETVERYPEVIYRGLDEKGREFAAMGQGLKAQAVQHELDHLNGKTYPDRMDPGMRDRLRAHIRKARSF